MEEMGMKKKTISVLTAFALTAVILVAGCSKKTPDNDYVGKWRYSYDTNKVSMKIENGGKASLDGEKYSYTEKDDGLVLENERGDVVKVRFKDNNENIYVYKSMNFAPKGSTEGLYGEWECGNNSFVFTKDGMFLEDGYFPGYFVINEEASSVILVYIDQFETTAVPFRLEEDRLIIDYPWEMMKL